MLETSNSLTYFARSDIPGAFFFDANCLRERGPPCMSSTVLYAISSRHLSRLPEHSTMRLFSCLQWSFEDSAFLLVVGFLPPRTTLLVRVDSALAV